MRGETRRATIARLNDHFRFTGDDGWTYLSRKVAVMPITAKEAVIRAVRVFDGFTPDNDPHGEHDCAILTVAGERIMWKIDYYPRDRARSNNPDPIDPATTLRVIGRLIVAPSENGRRTFCRSIP